MSLLQDRTAIVTGAGRGIGKSICLALASAGAHVVAAARSGDELQSLVEEIHADGGRATAVKTDISLERDISALFEKADAIGGGVDIVVNNAGIGIFGPVVEFKSADFDTIMDVNLRGTFLCCREAVARMIPRKSGYIINISSVVGFKGYPNQAAYTASKHGIMGITKSLANEVSDEGIRVSAILPGGVDTTLVGDARPDLDRSILMHPDDVAQSVMFLLSLSDRAAVDEIYIRRRSGKPFP
jgi:3-oxoacyl-[acyl-carrier protein] reductase